MRRYKLQATGRRPLYHAAGRSYTTRIPQNSPARCVYPSAGSAYEPL